MVVIGVDCEIGNIVETIVVGLECKRITVTGVEMAGNLHLIPLLGGGIPGIFITWLNTEQGAESLTNSDTVTLKVLVVFARLLADPCMS